MCSDGSAHMGIRVYGDMWVKVCTGMCVGMRPGTRGHNYVDHNYISHHYTVMCVGMRPGTRAQARVSSCAYLSDPFHDEPGVIVVWAACNSGVDCL